MKDSVFLSYPKPYLEKQKQFIEKVVSYLENRGLQPRTLGVTDYDMDATNSNKKIVAGIKWIDSNRIQKKLNCERNGKTG